MIEIQHLSKSFGNLEVLKDVSLTIKKGEVVTISVLPVQENLRFCVVSICWSSLPAEQFYLKVRTS